MNLIQAEMPVLYRHLGTWIGEYIYLDPRGTVMDRHESRVTSLCPTDRRYIQVNQYAWPDGRLETRNFDAQFKNGRIWFDNDLILGWAADNRSESVILQWRRKLDIQDNVNRIFHEMIQISDNNNHRCRTWQVLLNDVLEYRVVVTETRQSTAS